MGLQVSEVLLDCHRLGQITRLVYIAISEYRYMVG